MSEDNRAIEIVRKVDRAYWPRPELNESADRVAGEAMVDSLTLGELKEFFRICWTGPTFCLVTVRFEELMKGLPFFVEKRRQAALNALEQAKYAFMALRAAVEDTEAQEGE